MSTVFSGEIATRTAGSAVARGPYRNLRNDHVYMSLVQQNRQNNVISAAEFLAARRRENIARPDISGQEMREMIQNYNEQMIYLKGGVKAALEHGINVDSATNLTEMISPNVDLHKERAMAQSERRVRFGATAISLGVNEAGSLGKKPEQGGVVDSDLLELNEQVELLARQHGSKDSDFYRATDEFFEGDVFAQGGDRATPRGDGNADNDAADALHYTMSPPTPPEACLDGVEKAMHDALTLNEAVEDQLAHNKVSGLASAFESESVEKSKSAKEELSLEDFEDNQPIQQKFSEIALASVVRSEKNAKSSIGDEQNLHNCLSTDAYEEQEYEEVAEQRETTFEQLESATESIELHSQQDSYEHTKQEILEALHGNAKYTLHSEQRPGKEHSDAAKSAVCSAVYGNYRHSSAIEQSRPHTQAAEWTTSPKVRQTLNNSTQAVKATLTKREDYVERIKRQASATKARKRAEDRDIRLKLGLEE